MLVLFLFYTSSTAVLAEHHHEKTDDAAAGGKAKNKQKQKEIFKYDAAETIIQTKWLGESEMYDSSIMVWNNVMWLSWLSFESGKGDAIYVGQYVNGKLLDSFKCIAESGKYRFPTLTVNSRGECYLSYERLEESGSWNVYLAKIQGPGSVSSPVRISDGPGNNISHSVAADANGGLCFVWQADNKGQFDVMFRHVSNISKPTQHPVKCISESEYGDWSPSVAVCGSRVVTAWGSYDGDSFNVVARVLESGKWTDILPIANGKAFEGRVQMTPRQDGAAWILWEEGGENWGKSFIGRKSTDHIGALHRFRKTRLASLSVNNEVTRLDAELPMPSLELSAEYNRNSKKNAGARITGVFYELGDLTTDGQGRLWVIYRHYYLPYTTAHHIEKGWQVYARCFDGKGWSNLYAFDVMQRDGLQRLDLAGSANGVHVVYTSGRADRKNEEKHDTSNPTGLFLGSLNVEKIEYDSKQYEDVAPLTADAKPATEREAIQPVTVGGSMYKVYYGDLHRHTDLSLCFAYGDGSLEDAYRYGIEAAKLDFLGVTDHLRDLSPGTTTSLVWWRTVKAATRYRLSNTFRSYYSYEKSSSSTDHNVISLRDDMLLAGKSLQSLWNEMDKDTIMIPHNSGHIAETVWRIHDDEKRPLMEIYQGYRDEDLYPIAQAGYAKGYHLGLIGSSDHLSTSHSYACVWSADSSKEGIFRSMQVRRTFGATDKISLVFKTGNHWMGEIVEASETTEFQFEITGTGKLKEVKFYVGEQAVKTFTPDEVSFKGSFKPAQSDKNEEYYAITVEQEDGNMAWSSPIWIRKK
jgi:hypothetical protein